MSDTILVSTRKGLFTLARKGGAWSIDRVSFLGDNISLAFADPRDGAWYAALDHGHFGNKLQRSEDRGATWTEIGVPAYPEPPEGYVEKDFFGREVQWKLLRIWALESGGPDRKDRLWAGTIPGGLFKSEDRGATWTLCRSLWDDPRRVKWSGGGADFAGLHSICVDPRDSDHVTVAVSTGGVWETKDAGGSWELLGKGLRAEYMPPDQAHDPLMQDVHHLVRCPASPDVFYIQHHNGVFRSTDGARTFTEIKEVKPAVFGFAVVVHPKDPDTAWFVPATKDEKRIPVDGKVVVARTRDGAKTFEVLRKGLPQEHAYDLVLRHAMDIDASGQRIAFGSSTGSLWVTEDGGDSWQTVSEHLPPVYAVHFVH
ncbi:MAG TPA: hypothetical protein VJ483_08115 [Holophagaceae bacterium]|nr:hypothetical protein [Holophagaceae bacterium]